LFIAAATLAYAGALLTLPALLAIWRLSVDRSPRWAWAGAVMATFGAAGQMVHVMSYYGLFLAAVRQDNHEAAAQLIVGAESTPFVLSIFAPFFLGLLCSVPQAVGLRRARVVPLWACLALVTATAFFLFTGSTPWSSAIWTVLLVAGFLPAAAAMLHGDHAPASHSVKQAEAPVLA
jgi:hypothetical protein